MSIENPLLSRTHPYFHNHCCLMFWISHLLRDFVHLFSPFNYWERKVLEGKKMTHPKEEEGISFAHQIPCGVVLKVFPLVQHISRLLLFLFKFMLVFPYFVYIFYFMMLRSHLQLTVVIIKTTLTTKFPFLHIQVAKRNKSILVTPQWYYYDFFPFRFQDLFISLFPFCKSPNWPPWAFKLSIHLYVHSSTRTLLSDLGEP